MAHLPRSTQESQAELLTLTNSVLGYTPYREQLLKTPPAKETLSWLQKKRQPPSRTAALFYL